MNGFAARLTNNPQRDREVGVSFLDWGITPVASEDECRAEYPDHPPVFDPAAGGWLPALPGLCAFFEFAKSLDDVRDILISKARHFHASDAYKYIIIGRAELVGACWDGDVVAFDWHNVEIVENE